MGKLMSVNVENDVQPQDFGYPMFIKYYGDIGRPKLNNMFDHTGSGHWSFCVCAQELIGKICR